MSSLFLALIAALILNIIVVVVAWKWPTRARYFALAELIVLVYLIYLLYGALFGLVSM